MKRRKGSRRARCNFTVVTVILDHYCSIVRKFLFPPKISLRDALVSQEQNKEAIYFPAFCTISISYSFFPKARPCPRFVCYSWKNSSFVSLNCRRLSESLGQRMGWSWPRSKPWSSTYVIWSALGCAFFISLFTMVLRCKHRKPKHCCRFIQYCSNTLVPLVKSSKCPIHGMYHMHAHHHALKASHRDKA